MKLIQISAAMSLDGYIDDTPAKDRLRLSSEEDLHDMYASRALCDAILVGANTIRKDNPSLSCHLPELRDKRKLRGQPPEPIKVTLTSSGNLETKAKFFEGEGEKIILCPLDADFSLNKELATRAKIVKVKNLDAAGIIGALNELGVQSLFVEGGTSILSMFLEQGVFHRLRLAIAPFFVGSTEAARFVHAGIFKNTDKNRLRIESVRNLGNTAVLDIINDNYSENKRT